MCHVQETTLTLFIVYLSPLMSAVYILVNLFKRLQITFILNRITFIFVRDEDEDQ